MSWQIGSMIILFLALAGGMFWYEKSRPPSQIVALVAVLAALAVAGRIILAPIPNVVATTDIVFFAGYALGSAPGFAVGALGGLVSNFWLGQGAWTPWQMVGWGMTGVMGGVFWWMTRGKAGRIQLAVVCGLAGLVFGAWMNLQTMVSYGGEMSLERYLALEVRAIPFDLAHITGNVIFALAAGPAMVAALRRFRERFEWRAVAPAVSVLAVFVVAGGFALKVESASAASPVGNGKAWLKKQVNGNGGFGIDPGANSSLDMTTWVMLGLGRTGTDLDTVQSKNGSTPYDYLRNNRSSIDDTALLSKAVLALDAANKNPRSLGGVNLVKKLQHKINVNPTSGGKVNVAAYALMALRSVQVDSSELIDTEHWLCKAQNNDGGWGIASDSRSDVDSTGAVLQVVGGSGFKGKAIGFLTDSQTNNGGFGNASSATNSQSTALAVQGMLGAGYAVTSMENGGNNAIDYLERHQKSTGDNAGFIAYDGNSGLSSSVWVTAQAIPAMAEKSYFGGKPKDCNDFVPEDTSSGSSSDSSGSGSSSSGGSTPDFSAPSSSSGLGSSSTSGSGSGDSGSGNGSGSGNNDPLSGTGDTTEKGVTGVDPGTIDPTVVDPGVHVVPSAELVSASAAGPQPSPFVALAICLAVAGILIGSTLWLAKKFSW